MAVHVQVHHGGINGFEARRISDFTCLTLVEDGSLGGGTGNHVNFYSAHDTEGTDPAARGAQVDSIRQVLLAGLAALDMLDPAKGDQDRYDQPWPPEAAAEVDEDQGQEQNAAAEWASATSDQVRHHLTPPELRAHLLTPEGDGGHGHTAAELAGLPLDDEATHNLSHAACDPLDLADPATLGHTRADHELARRNPATDRGGPEGDDLDDDEDQEHEHDEDCLERTRAILARRGTGELLDEDEELHLAAHPLNDQTDVLAPAGLDVATHLTDSVIAGGHGHDRSYGNPGHSHAIEHRLFDGGQLGHHLAHTRADHEQAEGVRLS